MRFISVFLLFFSASVFADAPVVSIPVNSVEGTLVLNYQPKYCFTTPCPQFEVVKMNGKASPGLSADLLNLDVSKSSISSFRNVSVKGSWTVTGDYLQVTVSQWKAVITEKVDVPVPAPVSPINEQPSTGHTGHG